jgi:hypothetical protein
MQGERCFEIAETAWRTPPNQIDTSDYYKLKREITRLISPGVYKDPAGSEVEVFGPAVDRCADGPERAFLVTFRYRSGMGRGTIATIALFGEEGFFDLSKRPRYIRLEQQPNV